MTAGGFGTQGPFTLAAGVYTITANDSTAAGFSFSGLLCAGDNNGLVNVGTRTATINLDPGGNVACTSTSTSLAQPIPALSRLGLVIAVLALFALGRLGLRGRRRPR
jgi:hypothetical protein